jgi:hypothetical protein
MQDSNDKGFVETREIDCLQNGESAHIEDITSSKIQIIDDLYKVKKSIEQLNKNQETIFTDLNKNLIEWNTFNFAKKC